MFSSVQPDVPTTDVSGPRDEIQLSSTEKKVTRFLLDVLQYHSSDATLRIAGGWVRNKLLGLDSDDLDIVTDTISGETLANLIVEYQAHTGRRKSAFGIISRNPDQSKHLETVTIRLFGLDIDINQLRSETYASGSRIPTVNTKFAFVPKFFRISHFFFDSAQVEVAEPVEDALRRDFTLNALFYNIGTRCVEDFTHLGRQDLADGILRTPMDPVITLRDDPLRMLRGLRFMATYNFSLDADFVAACGAVRAREQLEQKVSRERMGIEVQKMFGSMGFVRAADKIAEFKLEQVLVGSDAGKSIQQSPITKTSLEAMHLVMSSPTSPKPTPCLNTPIDPALPMAAYFLAMHPLAGALSSTNQSSTEVDALFGAVEQLRDCSWTSVVLDVSSDQTPKSFGDLLNTQSFAAAQDFGIALQRLLILAEDNLDEAVCRQLKLPKKLMKQIARLQTAGIAFAVARPSPALHDGGSSDIALEAFTALWAQWTGVKHCDSALSVATVAAAVSQLVQDSASGYAPGIEDIRSAVARCKFPAINPTIIDIASRPPIVNGGDAIHAGVPTGKAVGTFLSAAKVLEVAAKDRPLPLRETILAWISSSASV